MKSMIKVRNSLIIVLCFTIICMGVGFIFLALKLDEKNKDKPYFNVVFYSVREETSVKGGTIAPSATNSITNNGKEVTMNFKLNNPHDEFAYTIIIKNEGNIPAQIYNIKETPDYTNNATAQKEIAPISITHTDIVGKVLQPNDEIQLKVLAVYNNSKEKTALTTKKVDYQLTLIAASPNN